MGRKSINPLSIIVAVDERGGFAKNYQIPWNLPEDLKHLKETTMGHPCVMGRHTYEELANWYIDKQNKNEAKGKQVVPLEQVTEILPGRESFVVTSNMQAQFPGAIAVGSMRKAIQMLDHDDDREVFVFGGFRLFTEALSWADKVYMTIVKKDYHCDRFFPTQFVNKNFKIVDGKQMKRVDFVTYQRQT